ncbi:MarR family winged helix-turn-helix transcriptional regulator [Streptomyces sp. NPDC102365]|uniref:MarR family winged helix-turn-helix transcriptional regulator n=1 Tax=Streptomyces sp. NPDC102365 TaxID=3366162 RepID=UPI003811AC3F
MPAVNNEGVSARKSAITGSLALLLVGAGRAAQRRIEDALATDGLTLRHLGALSHLSRRPDLSYSDLARRAGVTAPSMHATVRQLQDLGVVAGVGTGQGQRARLEVTPQGHELLAGVAERLHGIDEELLEGLPEEHREHVKAFLAGVVPGSTGIGDER